MNFFEQELRKLFEDGSVIHAPWFSGNNCRGTLDADLRVRVQFVCCRVSGDYDGLALTVLDRTGGKVDDVTLHTGDIWDIKDKVTWTTCPPHINNYPHNKYNWNVYTPSAADYDALRKAAAGYLNVYRSQVMDRERIIPPVLPPMGRSSASHPLSKTGYER